VPTGDVLDVNHPTDDIGFLANRFTRVMRAHLAEGLAAEGLTPQQAAVLLAVLHAPDAPTPSAVADALDIDRPTMTGLVRRLERDGWLCVRPNPHDSRSRLLAPSDRCSDARPRIEAAAAAVGRTLATRLGADRMRELVLLLDAASDALRPVGVVGR